MTYLIAYHDKMRCSICGKRLYIINYEKHKLSKRHKEMIKINEYKKQKKFIISFD